MDLMSIVNRILSSGDVYLAFKELTKELTQQQKVTVAREVNKGLFTKHLQNAELNQHIVFDVIRTNGMHKEDDKKNKNNRDSDFKKTASFIQEEVVKEKKELIKEAMFVLRKREDTIRDYKSDNTFFKNDNSDLLKEASRVNHENNERVKSLKNDLLAKKAEIKMVKDTILSKIASLSNDPSTTRTIIKRMVEEGFTKEAEKMLVHSRVKTEDLTKVASYKLDDYQDKELRKYIKQLNNANDVEKQLNEFDISKHAGLAHVPINIAKHVFELEGRAIRKIGEGLKAVPEKVKPSTALKLGLAGSLVGAGVYRFIKNSDNVADSVVGGY